MNLYELAHHPDAFKHRGTFHEPACWYRPSNTNEIQYKMLNESDSETPAADYTDNENEFRMHLLFVYFATTPTEEWPT